MRRQFLTCALAAMIVFPGWAAAADYVGTKTCGGCHDKQHQVFVANSKKARSWKSVEVMAPKLTEGEFQGCLGCHTTGYGRGGFRSLAETPELADVGCETCHGAGGRHAASGDPKDISKPKDRGDCCGCHNESRVKAFSFKPMLVSGAH